MPKLQLQCWEGNIRVRVIRIQPNSQSQTKKVKPNQCTFLENVENGDIERKEFVQYRPREIEQWWLNMSLPISLTDSAFSSRMTHHASVKTVWLKNTHSLCNGLKMFLEGAGNKHSLHPSHLSCPIDKRSGWQLDFYAGGVLFSISTNTNKLAF